MDDPDGTYAPQSPDISAHHHPPFSSDQSNSYYPSQPQQAYQQTSYITPTNYHNPYATQLPVQSSVSYIPPSMMPRKGQRQQHDDSNDTAWAPGSSTRVPGRKGKKERVQEICDKLAPGRAEGIEVKTKFPVARIKRIMQADEDVGKVAQVTPTAVSKALELFMISVVSKAAGEARTKGTKRVTAAHLKQAVEKDEQLDFLATIIAKVPDAPTKKDEDSEEAGEGKKRKAGTRKRKKDPDDF